MGIVRPTITEDLFRNFFKLEPDRPMYYLAVYRLARSIFINLNFHDQLEKMQNMIRVNLEVPLKSDFESIVYAFYEPRFIMSKQAYTKVGDEIDYIEVTRYDINRALENIKNWIYDEVISLAQYVRFTRQSDIYA